MMTAWAKIKSLFRVSDRPKHAESPRLGIKRTAQNKNHGNTPGQDSDEEDPCGALSEVAAPEPVQRLTPEDLARHPSLEQRLSDISRSGHNSEDDIYETLSELAAPEPIERVSESERARRPSLEQSLSRVSH
ncbi:hypothetical protein BJX76DRAFT_334865 [Aspergillus varians]